MKLINVQLTADDIRSLSELLADGINNNDCGLISAKSSDPAAVLKQWRACSGEYVEHSVRRDISREDANEYHRLNERDAEILERLLAGTNVKEVCHA